MLVHKIILNFYFILRKRCVCVWPKQLTIFFSNLEGFLLDITEKEIIFVKFVADPILYNSFL